MIDTVIETVSMMKQRHCGVVTHMIDSVLWAVSMVRHCGMVTQMMADGHLDQPAAQSGCMI